MLRLVSLTFRSLNLLLFIMDTCMRVLLTLALLLSVADGLPANSAAAPAPTPLGLTPDGMKDAFPSRDLLDASNWYGTSLYGWDKCKEKDPTWKEKIIEAYTDSNKLVNLDGVRKDLDFNSAAALEYLGPSGKVLLHTTHFRNQAC